MIAFDERVSLDEWPDLHPAMRELLFWLDDHWPEPVLVITRIDKPVVPNETGVHHSGPPHRFVDARTRSLGRSVGEAMAFFINTYWDYGDDRHKVAVYHVGTGPHLHLQVRNETHLREAA